VNLLVAKRIIISDNRINPKRFAIEVVLLRPNNQWPVIIASILEIAGNKLRLPCTLANNHLISHRWIRVQVSGGHVTGYLRPCPRAMTPWMRCITEINRELIDVIVANRATMDQANYRSKAAP